jgi:hypothetical protein
MMKLMAWRVLVLLVPVAWAETPEERGLAIAVEQDRRDLGWGDSQANMKMILRNAYGEEGVRILRVRYLEVEADGDKSLMIVDKPADVDGTALLTFSHAAGDDDQWLYLPALKRVKRISSSNKSGPFMGSEFAYEDMTSPEVEKYRYKFLGEEMLDGVKTFKVENIPVDKNSGYTRLVNWIDQEEYRTLKTEFYDRKGTLLKTLTLNDYKRFLDQYWRPHSMYMHNHQSGKSTDLILSVYQFRVGLTSNDFTRNRLKMVK